MKKRISRQVSPTAPREILAEFELDGDAVRATYYDEVTERLLKGGLFMGKLGRLTPSRGRVFFDNLERALANSSRIAVETIE